MRVRGRVVYRDSVKKVRPFDRYVDEPKEVAVGTLMVYITGRIGRLFKVASVHEDERVLYVEGEFLKEISPDVLRENLELKGYENELKLFRWGN